MKPVIIILIAFVLLFIPVSAHAIDYVDSSGYTPSWATGQEYHYVLNQCNNLIGDYSSDGNWCYEWVAYVLDQGVDNFPESTKSDSSPKSFKLEDGPLYSGNLVSFLPDKTNFGSDWQVGQPFTMENLEQMKSGGLVDFTSQRIVIPDLWDETNFLKISFIIMELENEKSASEFYSKTKESIYSQNFPNVVEYFELYDQGIFSDKLELERSSEYTVADCIGQIINYDRENEEAKLTCIKENYIIAVMASWKTALYNPSFTLGGTESAVDEYSEIMVKNIENNSQKQPQKSPSNIGTTSNQMKNTESVTEWEIGVNTYKVDLKSKKNIYNLGDDLELIFSIDHLRLQVVDSYFIYPNGEKSVDNEIVLSVDGDDFFKPFSKKFLWENFWTEDMPDGQYIMVFKGHQEHEVSVPVIYEKTPKPDEFFPVEKKPLTESNPEPGATSFQNEIPPERSENNGGGCLIATATYGKSVV